MLAPHIEGPSERRMGATTDRHAVLFHIINDGRDIVPDHSASRHTQVSGEAKPDRDRNKPGRPCGGADETMPARVDDSAHVRGHGSGDPYAR